MLTNEGWIPMVAADRNRLESLRPLARQIAAATNKEIKLIHMGGRQDVEVIRP